MNIMKRIVFLVVVITCFIVYKANAQGDSLKIENLQEMYMLEKTQVDTDSLILIHIQEFEDMLEHLNPRYRLYETSNIWTFLKLDTQTGRIWQIQFSTDDSKYRFESIINDEDLSFGVNDNPGRFELHKTQNIYNFLLIDHTRGRVWQVQWGKPKDRMIIRIY